MGDMEELKSVSGEQFIQKAQAMYADCGLQSVEVEGIGSIFYRPITLKERGDIQKIAKTPAELPAATIVVKALDQDGARMFKTVNKGELIRSIEAKILDDIAYQMVERQGVEGRVRD